MTLETEIGEQPEGVARLLSDGAGPIEAVAAAVTRASFDHVVIAARGSSDHAAIYGQYLLGVRNGLVVGLAAPSIVSVYRATLRLDRALVIGISQSGESPDIVSVVAAARDQGRPSIAITNAPGSALARAADHVIDLDAGPELSIAATKTYTAELLALAMLSVALRGDSPGRDPDLRRVPRALEEALGAGAEASAAAAMLAGSDHAQVVGRGFGYATAREWALKLKELAGILADPYSAADMEHGPVALVGPGACVLAVATSGRTLPGMRRLLVRLRDDLGAETIVLSDRPDVRRLGARSVTAPGGLPEWLAPIGSIVPAQLVAVEAARLRGHDPEHPRHLSKVTRTR